MAWVRVDDHFTGSAKAIKAGAAALGLWLDGMCYANQYLTDGHIPIEIVRKVRLARDPIRLARRLVDVGLWSEVDGGFQIVNYLKYQHSRVEIEARRRKDVARKSARNPDGIQTESEPRARARVGLGVSAIGISLDREGESEGKQPPRLQPVRLHSAVHRTHAVCGVVCLPAFLAHELARKSGREDGIEYVAEWAGRVLDEWQAKVDAGEVIGDDDIVFWRARWQETHGTTRQRTADADRKAKQAAANAYAARWREKRDGEGV